MSSKGKEVDKQEQTEEAAEGSASSAKSSVTLQVCVQPHLQLPNLASKDFIPLVSAQLRCYRFFFFWYAGSTHQLFCYLKKETSILAGVKI